MTTPSIDEYRSKLRDALGAIKDLRTALANAEAARSEPIAIVGMACRFPRGIRDPDAFWTALRNGVDVIGEIDRWPQTPVATGKRGAQWAGLISGIDLFDCAFFGIAPREAQSLDPQQRLLLEVSWESLENAGIVPATLLGTRTGVFVGLTAQDYQQRLIVNASASFDAYCLTGNLLCTAGGRLSFVYGFQGPCVSIDTACSSSLVAIHLACQSLRNRESDLVIAGGVNAILSPIFMSMVAETGALSPDGRCKTFDASANGYVRSEGCGLLVLKRISDAHRDGDRIWAVIRGSAVNQDGRSTGLTTPNVLAQQQVIRQALENAKLTPEQISYVEAHGTGTSLGDPIEMDALRAIYGKPSIDGEPLIVGALKSNLGHLESAAGVAGVIKTALALNRQSIPRNNHFRSLNPRISLEGTRLAVAARERPWPRKVDRPRRAGISAFGISGTNAHLILEEAAANERTHAPKEASAYLIPISAKTPAALSTLAHSFAEWFAQPDDTSLDDISYTASIRRTHHEHRLAIVARTREEFAQLLRAFVAHEGPADIAQRSTSAHHAPRVVFVFPGQGSQWIGMGRQLLASEPVFRCSLESCNEVIRKESGFSIIEEIAADEQSSRLGNIDVVQPLLFAIEVAVATLWRSWGIEPDCVIGHSMGEVAAAYVAGILGLEDAAKVICRRSRLLKRIRGLGAMGLVELSMTEAEAAIVGYESRLSIAVSNGPRSTVLSGDPTALEDVLVALESKGIFCRRIKVDVASHSPQVDSLRVDLLDALADVKPLVGKLAMRSTVTGQPTQGPDLVANYWADNLRLPVRFSEVTRDLIEQGCHIFVEMSPHPILLPSVEENLRTVGVAGLALASMRRQVDARRTMLESLGSLYAYGCNIAWEKQFPERGGVVALPTYPWQRERYWLETARLPAHAQRVEGGHPLLGQPVRIASLPHKRFWEQVFYLDSLPWLRDHQVRQTVVFPGVGYAEMAFAMAQTQSKDLDLCNVSFEQMLTVGDDVRIVQSALERQNDGSALFEVASRNAEDETWIRHASGILSPRRPLVRREPLPVDSIRLRCSAIVSVDALYANFNERSVHYGSSFRGLSELWVGNGEAFGHVHLPDDVMTGGFLVHPALLDACLHCLAALWPSTDLRTYVPAAMDRLTLVGSPGRDAWVYARRHEKTKETERPRFDVSIIDEHGNVLIDIEGFHVASLDQPSATQTDPLDSCVHVLSWREKARGQNKHTDAAGRWLVVGHAEPIQQRLVNTLVSRGGACVRVTAEKSLEQQGPDAYAMDLCNGEYWRTILEKSFPTGSKCRGVVYLAKPDEHRLSNSGNDIASTTAFAALSVVKLVQALLQLDWRDAPQVFLVTRGAVATTGTEDVPHPECAMLWGLGRTIALEHPELSCTCIDFAPESTETNPEQLVEELLGGGNESQVALRDEKRFVSRIVPDSITNASARDFTLQQDASYLVTGGLGGLGLALTKWMVQQGARHLVLVGRSAPTATVQTTLEDLMRNGARILCLQSDISVREDVMNVLQRCNGEMPPLRGIVHAAGILDDQILTNLEAERIRRVLAPKVQGSLWLDELTRDIPLDFFILYSSAASLLGSPGQAHYAAANAFMDGLAHHRIARGLPAMSIQWGTVAEVGLAAAQDNRGKRLGGQGITSLSVDEFLQAQARLFSRPRCQIGILHFSLRQWREFHPRAANMPYLSELQDKHITSATGQSFRDTFKRTSPSQRRATLERHILEHLARVLRLAADRIDVHEPFRTYGIDSLMSLEVRNHLESTLCVRLSAALLYTYPTIDALAAYLMDILVPSARAVSNIDVQLDTRTASLGEVEVLSDQEAAALLESKLLDLEEYLP